MHTAAVRASRRAFGMGAPGRRPPRGPPAALWTAVWPLRPRTSARPLPGPWAMLAAGDPAGKGVNPFVRRLQQFEWLGHQRAEYLSLKQQVEGLAATKGGGGETAGDLLAQLEALHGALAAQEAGRRAAEKEYARDRQAMEQWFLAAGLGEAAATAATEHTAVRRGLHHAALPRLTPADLRGCPGVTPEDVQRALAHAQTEMAGSASTAAAAEESRRRWAEGWRAVGWRALILLGLAALWGLYILLTAPTPRAVLALLRPHRPELPEVYIPREDVEGPIAAATRRFEPVSPSYTLLLGPKGSGKSCAARFVCRRAKGVVRATVLPGADPDLVYEQVAVAMGLPPRTAVDRRRFVAGVLRWAAWFLRRPPVVILDVFDRQPADTVAAVRQVARDLAPLGSVIVCLTPAAYARECLLDPQASARLWVRDLDDREAAELTGWSPERVATTRAAVGLRPGVLHRLLATGPEDQIVAEAAGDLDALVARHPRHAAALRRLTASAAADPALGGLPLAEYEAVAGGPLPSSPVLCLDAAGARVAFMSPAHYTAAQRHPALQPRRWPWG